jgi:diguanylate cyclase (GGDEF)-like protein/PAS domain S-box-containing protein
MATKLWQRKLNNYIMDESAELAQALIRCPGLGIYIVQDGKFQYANAFFQELTGYTEQELRSIHPLELVHPEDRELVREKAIENLKGRSLLPYEYKFIKKNGEVMWNLERLASTEYRGKRAVVGSFVEVTERKRAEESLRRSEQNFRDSIENSPLGIRVLDKDEKTLYANRALLDLWGYSSLEELEAVPRKQRYTPDSYAEHMERLKKRRRGEAAPLSYEASIVRSDGQVRILSSSRGELMWNGEKRFQVVSQDITESKRAEVELELRSQLLDSATDSIFVHDFNGNFVYVNETACRAHGYSREEFMKLKLQDIVVQNRPSGSLESDFQEMLEKGQARIEAFHRRKDGSVMPVEVHGRPVEVDGRKLLLTAIRDVTERKRAEEALAKSEERYRTVLEQMEEAYYETDIAGKFTFGNDAMCRQLGYSTQELIGMSFKVITPPEDVKEIFSLYNQVYRTGKPFTSASIKRVRKDGTRISTETSAFPLRNESGDIVGFRGIAADVTERRKMEEALRRSEQNFRDSIESSPLGIRILDEDGKALYANRALLDIWGYSSLEELEAVPKEQRYTPQAYAEHVERFKRRKQGEYEALNYETSIVRSDGQVRHISASRGELLWGGKECFQVVYQDITERKQLQEALAKSEERYRTILAEIQEGYYEVDLAGNFTFVNDAVCRQLGYSREELIGMNYTVYVPKDEVKGVYKAWNKVYRTGNPLQSYPFTGIRKDKKQIFLEASVSPSRDNEGKIIGFRSVSRDVTERAQYEQKLAEMATHDALTGLPNRTLLSDRFTVALALSRRSRSRLAVLMLDLDRFKVVNDSMGHDVGDKLLKVVGKRLEVTVRKSDTVARIGGDEFVLVLPQIPYADEAASFAQRILDTFREPFVFDGHRINITASIGIAVYPEAGKDIESLLKSADTAMYWAKEQGRDIYRFYDGSETATLLAKRRTTA